MSSSAFKIENGKLVEYRGEQKHFTLMRDKDVIAKVSFYCKDHIKEVTVPGCVREIGFFAFKDCSSLEKLILENGIEALEIGAFWHCPCLKDIFFCHSLRYVSPDAFPVESKVNVHINYVAGLWPALRKAKWLIRKVPEDIRRKYSGALIAMKLAYGRYVRLVMHIGADVKEREFYKFPVDCTVVLEDDVQVGRVFQCAAISKVHIGKEVRVLHPEVFSGGAEHYEDTSLEVISVDEENKYFYSVDGVLFDSEKRLLRYPQMKVAEKSAYHVPENTSFISAGAFSWSYGIEHIYVPSTTKIGHDAFSNIPRLETIYVEGKDE